MCKYGLVNRIIPFSCVDGPGNRSAVFFQGCEFRCAYCHNPETQNLCTSCGVCVSQCPTKALTMGDKGVLWNSELCCSCDQCLNVCPSHSSPKARWMSVDDIFQELQGALPFITGITISGGECTQYHQFAAKLFDRAHELGKTAFCDTNGQLPFREMPELTAVMDMAMLDVKAWNDERHRELTGKSNRIVLDNLNYLSEIGKLYEVRTVIVPGLLNNEETVEQVSRHLAHYPEIRYKLIKYRPWGVRPPLEVQPPSDQYMEQLRTLACENGANEVVLT